MAGVVGLVPPAQAAFPGQNGKITFSRLAEVIPTEPTQDIFIMNADGSGQDNLSDNDLDDPDANGNATRGYEYNPAFSPDGTKIAFDGRGPDIAVGGSRDIWVMNSDGTGHRRLPTNPASDEDPSFSPDGQKIVFLSSRGEPSLPKGELYMMNADGTGTATRLTDDTFIDYAPTFSPDGTRIAYSSSRDSRLQIIVMNADGSGQTQLTNSTGGGSYPAFSPDGRTIAFQSSVQSGNTDIFTMAADGSGEVTRLTLGLPADSRPTFSPDGTKIAFQSRRDHTPTRRSTR